MTTRFEVSRAIAAPPTPIFDVCAARKATSRSTRPGCSCRAPARRPARWATGSPSTWTARRSTTSPSGCTTSTSSSPPSTPSAKIAWTIEGQLKPNIGHVYGYRLEPIDGGTMVTSYYDWSDIHPEWAKRDIFPIIPESALRATLGILARTVAPGKARPDA